MEFHLSQIHSDILLHILWIRHTNSDSNIWNQHTTKLFTTVGHTTSRFFLMFVFCWELWHKYMQNSSVIAINAIKWFVKPLTSIQKFFFKKIPKLKSYVQFFQFSDTFTERLVRHRWTRPHTEADALQNTSVSRKSDIHSWSVSQTPFVFTSTFKKPIRHRWCSGLGRETAPSASNEGQRTLRKKVKGHG